MKNKNKIKIKIKSTVHNFNNYRNDVMKIEDKNSCVYILSISIW